MQTHHATDLRPTPAPAPPPLGSAEPSGPAEALAQMVEGGGAQGFGADRVSVIAALPSSPILTELLSEIDAVAEGGLVPRIVLGRAGRSAADMARLFAAAPRSCVRLADFRGARALAETAIIGVSAQWTGRPLAWRPDRIEAGRFTRFVASEAGKRRAALAHAQFDRAWEASSTL